jgi:hypothetical protein
MNFLGYTGDWERDGEVLLNHYFMGGGALEVNFAG